jgi:hypothetical protein
MQHSDLSYTEVLSCLEDAKQGLLSPYWQGYAKRELDSLRDSTGALPPDAEILARQLQSVLASTPQISDHTFIENEAAAQGNKLIYDYHGTSHDAFAVILYSPEKQAYTASVSLPYSSATARTEALALQEDLLQWLAGHAHEAPLNAVSADAAENGYYKSLEAAAASILGELSTAMN